MTTIIAGAADFLGAGLIIVLARGITVVMKNAYMTDTILHWMENAVSGTSSGVFAILAFIVNLPIAFLVPSSSGHAALVMPILAPLADFAGVSRAIAVTAFQSASGLVNLVTPTSAVIMGGWRSRRSATTSTSSSSGRSSSPSSSSAVRSSASPRRSDELGKEIRMSTATETALGRHSEVGKLRTVMVHRPDLAHERLSPTNCHELLFDDVIWVRRARQEHDAFVDLMRERGVEVLLLHDLLAETLEDAEAREWLLSRGVRAGGRHGDVRRAAEGVADATCPPTSSRRA